MGTFKLNDVNLNLGMVVVDNLAVEGFYNLASTSEFKIVNGGNLTVKSGAGYGFGIRPFVNLTNDIELFGRIALSRAKQEYATAAESGSTTETAKIYGVGVAYKISKELSLVADYKKIKGITDSNVSTTGLGVRYNF